MRYEALIKDLLTQADVTINGNRPWDLHIHNPQFFERVFAEQDLGLGESYMDGWWDCERIDEFISRVLRAKLDIHLKTYFLKNKMFMLSAIQWYLKEWVFRFFNYQKKSRAFEIGERHYDVGNDLFSCMLDKEMNYTCAYWKNATDLDSAQLAKLKLVCDKLYLQPGQRILDIGCGWGALARFAAKYYQVSVVGLTVSKEQKRLADELCKGLPIEIRLQDYREINEPFDHIVSLGMFEHVGYKNYNTYMEVAHRCLKENGLFLLHTIGTNVSSTHTNQWINQYIFPNGALPSIAQIGKACERRFVMEDWHNFGVYYDKTLMAWHANFNQHWPELKAKYSERFKRMWDYYLLSCAGAFRARDVQLWQIVLSKNGVPGGYISIR